MKLGTKQFFNEFPDMRRLMVWAELRDQVYAAPHLERRGRQVVLVLHPYVAPHELRELRVGAEGGWLEMRRDPDGGLAHVVQGGLAERRHAGCSLATRMGRCASS